MKILAVDDERLALDRLINILHTVENNAEVYDFTNPADALSFLSSTPCDIVFLDIEMFGITGIELALRCKKLCHQINIIFVTGYSQYALEAIKMHASGYILKPANEESVKKELCSLRNPIKSPDKSESADEQKIHLRAQTFGNFEIFYDEKPVVINSSKAKEMLALLIDRKGSGVTIRDIALALWENKEYTRSIKNQIQHLISYLFDVLTKYNSEKLLIRSWNNLSVDCTKIKCDYYDFLSGDVSAINSFQGEYMTSYSWAEFTTGYLEDSKARQKE